MEVERRQDRIVIRFDRHEARELTEAIADAWYLRPIPAPLERLVETLTLTRTVYAPAAGPGPV